MEAAELIIETNVQLPAKGKWRAKLDILEIGDSFSFPIDKREYIAFIISTKFHARGVKRFTVSSVDQPAGTARVWRLDDNE